MTFRVRINDPAVIDRLTVAVKRVGEVADMIGAAASAVTVDPAKVRRRAWRPLSWAGAAAWASLLDRIV